MEACAPQLPIPNQFDVLVVGAGAAGLYVSLCLPPSYRVGLISKDPLSLSASDWAQGGLAAAIDPDDAPKLHFEDTMRAGAGLCDLDAVKFLVEQAPSCVKSLLELGVAFDRSGEKLALTLEAAHSRRRVLHAADTTGRAVVGTLTARVLQRQNIIVLPEAFALSLWMDATGERCRGISLVYRGQISWVRASAVVLATGGGGQVFARTTNPALSTGDGVAIAARAGAILRDLEFVQFHPTALNKPGAPHFLISEAVRGEGAHLVDARGRRFAFDYHPAGELAPRDVVSRAIFSYLQNTGLEQVWLDLRSIPTETIQRRFPNIIQVCRQWGIDVFSEPVPVTPAAHYWMGGIATDLRSRTSIAGLYAVGETASTGVHGANRLASNSLLECIVFGGQLAHLELDSNEIAGESSSISPLSLSLSADENLAFSTQQSLKSAVWQTAGICRSAEGLERAIAQIETLKQEFNSHPLSQFLLDLPPLQSVVLTSSLGDRQLRQWSETRNLLDVASLILKSAAFRTESRGGHFRQDFPQTFPQWQVHTLVQTENWWKSQLLVERQVKSEG